MVPTQGISRSLPELHGKNNGYRKWQRLRGKVISAELSCARDATAWMLFTGCGHHAQGISGQSGGRLLANGSPRSCLEQRAGGGTTSPGHREGNAETRSNYSLAAITLPLLKMTMRSLESTLAPDVCMGHSFSPCPVACLICDHQCTKTSCPSYSKCVFWVDLVLSMLGKVAWHCESIPKVMYLLNYSCSGWIYYVSIAARRHFWWREVSDQIVQLLLKRGLGKVHLFIPKINTSDLPEQRHFYNCNGDKRKILGYHKAVKTLRDLPALLLPSYIKWRQTGLPLHHKNYLWSFSKYIYKRDLKAFAGKAVLPQGYSTRVWERKCGREIKSDAGQEWGRGGDTKAFPGMEWAAHGTTSIPGWPVKS